MANGYVGHIYVEVWCRYAKLWPLVTQWKAPYKSPQLSCSDSKWWTFAKLRYCTSWNNSLHEIFTIVTVWANQWQFYAVEMEFIIEIYRNRAQSSAKNLGQNDRPDILGCEPVDGVLVVNSLNQLNIAIFVHQMGDPHISHLINKSINI